MAMSEDDDLPDVTARDALQIAQRALAKSNDLEETVEELRADHEQLKEEHVALELRISEQDAERPYESYSLEEKVGMVREYGYEKALDRGGRAKFDYDSVIYEIFDGDPSADHAYKLMRLAAEGTQGFTYREDQRPSVLLVNAEQAKRNHAFSSAKNFTSGGGSV
jgi:hypothetical protein